MALLQEAVPFFSNNLAGILKVVATIVLPTTLLLGGFFWKVIQGPQQRQLEEVRADHGRRLTEVEKSQTREDQQLTEMRRDVDRHQFTLDNINVSLGELKARVESAERTTLDAKAEIIQAFQNRTDKILDRVGELDKSVVRVETTIGMRRRERDTGERAENT